MGMKAIVYERNGGSDVLHPADRPMPEPGPGEVRVRVHVSGVNPTDWKSRAGYRAPAPGGQVPHHDGAGVVDKVGPGVDPARVGSRVWLMEAAHGRADGTAQEYLAIPSRLAIDLPDGAPFDLGASLGVPAVTAHRALTVAPDGPRALAPGALAGRTVLVAGGAGAVGNAAIQLARWAGAQVLSTVSGPAKGALAEAAGAHAAIDYTRPGAADRIRALAEGGVDLVVEVAVAANHGLDDAVLAPGGAVAFYGGADGETFPVPVRDAMTTNRSWHGILLYTLTPEAKERAVADVSAAVAAGALRVEEEVGLPLHRYPLERTADAQDAVEKGAIGKVLIDVPGPIA
jgi:NADPH2:quinone reductase